MTTLDSTWAAFRPFPSGVKEFSTLRAKPRSHQNTSDKPHTCIDEKNRDNKEYKHAVNDTWSNERNSNEHQEHKRKDYLTHNHCGPADTVLFGGIPHPVDYDVFPLHGRLLLSFQLSADFPTPNPPTAVLPVLTGFLR
jgi:hypothetical protein